MMGVTRYFGEWWRPDQNQGDAVPGTLIVGDDGSAELELLDYFAHEAAEGPIVRGLAARPEALSRVVGVVEGKGYSLEDCFIVNRRFGAGGREPTRLHVNHFYRGVVFEEGEEPTFTQITVGMDWFAFWVQKSGLSEAFDVDGDDGPKSVRLAVEALPSDEFGGPGGSRCSIGQTWSVSGDGVMRRSFDQDFVFTVIPAEPQSATELLELAGDMQALVSLGTDHNAAFTSVTFRHAEIHNGENEYAAPIEMVAAWSVHRDYEDGDTAIGPVMPLPLGTLAGPEVIGSWLEAARTHRSEVARVMSTVYSERMFLSDKVLNCAAALESYDRSRHENGPFRTRLLRTIRRVGDPFGKLVNDADGWATALKDARNDVAHHNPAMHGTPAKHLFLAHSARWLLLLAILTDAGVPGETLETAMGKRGPNWIRQGLDDAFATGWPVHGEA